MWPHEIAMSPDNKTAFVTHFGLKDYDELVGAAGSTISVIDVGEMCEQRRLYTFGQGSAPLEEQYFTYRAPHGIRLQPGTSRLFVNVESNLLGENNHHMLVYELGAKGNVPAHVWDIPENTHNFIFSKDGSSLWLFSGPDGVTRYSTNTSAVFSPPREIAHFVPAKGAVRGLTLTEEETQLIASGSGEMLILEPKTLKLLRTIPIPEAQQFLYSAVGTDGRFVFAPAVWEGKVYPIDLKADAAEAVKTPIVLGSDPVHVAMAPGENLIYVTHGRDNFISVVDVSGLRKAEQDSEHSSLIEVTRVKTHDGPNRVATIPLSEAQARKLRPKRPRPRIRFAACLPLSGQNQAEGQDMRLGYQYWRDSVNERGGLYIDGKAYEVELDLRDTMSLSKGAQSDEHIRNITQQLIDKSDRDLVRLFFLGTYPTPPNITSAAVAKGLPFVTAGAAGVVAYQQQGEGAPKLDNIFGVMSPARGFLNGTMDMIFGANRLLATTEVPPRSGVFITSDDFGAFQDAVTTGRHVLRNYGDSFSIVESPDLAGLKAFRVESIPADGNAREFSLITYEHPETADQIQTLRREFPLLLMLLKRKTQPELIALTAHMPQSIDFTEAAATAWPQEADVIPKAIVLSVGPGNPAFTQQLARRGVSPENLLGASVWSPNQRQCGHDEFIDSQTFREKFEAKFHKAPSYLTAGAVACGLVYEEAFRRANSTDSARVRDALQSISDHADNRLASGAIELFYSRIDFRDDAEIRGLNDKRPLGTIQLQVVDGQVDDVVLWPSTLRQGNGRLVYPFPGFKTNGNPASRMRAFETDTELWKY